MLIHGFGSDRLSWLGTSPALMPLGRVHALDLPGHGDSRLDVPDVRPGDLVTAVAAAIRHHASGPAHLIGHSLGGALAMMIAAEAPETVASLTLIAPAGLGRGIDRSFVSAFRRRMIPTPWRRCSASSSRARNSSTR